MTLTELLVVMAIMLILVSAVVVAVFRVSSQAPVKGTQALLQKLAIGLDAYRATYRIYPPQDNIADPVGNPPPPWPDYWYLDPIKGQTYDPRWIVTPVQASTFALWYALEYQGQGQFMTPVSSAYKAAGGYFTDPATGSLQTWYYYQDAWKQPIRYVCVYPYRQYTLTSGGPDLILGTADDITVP
jgi:type II secretory pathway pseudopilin PulG